MPRRVTNLGESKSVSAMLVRFTGKTSQAKNGGDPAGEIKKISSADLLNDVTRNGKNTMQLLRK